MSTEIHVPSNIEGDVLLWCYFNIDVDKWKLFNHTILSDMLIIQFDCDEDAIIVKLKFGL